MGEADPRWLQTIKQTYQEEQLGDILQQMISVWGKGVEPKNLMVAVGTKVEEILVGLGPFAQSSASVLKGAIKRALENSTTSTGVGEIRKSIIGNAASQQDCPRLHGTSHACHEYKLYELRFANGQAAEDAGLALFFVDTDRTKFKLEEWVRKVSQRSTVKNPTLPPLFINGLVKSGKTHALRFILPAIICVDPVFGQGSDSPADICMLNLLDSCSGSYGGNLQALLTALLSWCTAEKDFPDLHYGTLEALEASIIHLIKWLPRFTFVLIDEVQAFYSVEEGNLDRARRFLKTLIQNTTESAAFALTGSSMAYFWLNVAQTITNGTPLQQHNSRIDLPCSVPASAISATWRWIEQFWQLPVALAKWVPDLPSIQVHFASTFRAAIDPATDDVSLRKFALTYERTKLCQEVKLDMGHVLAKMTKLERLVLRQLLINEEGIREDNLACGLADFFQAYLVPKAGAPGLVILDAPWHRSALADLVDNNGNIVQSSIGPTEPVKYLRVKEALGRFGEEVSQERQKNGGVLSSCATLAFKGFVSMHGGVFTPGPWWTKHQWVQALLTSAANSRGAAQKFQKCPTDEERAAQLFVMLRNVICHTGLSGTTGNLIVDFPFFSSSSILGDLRRLAKAAFP